ncbi:glycosyltransferase family 2 protein [Microbacterium sp. NPDC006705]|uniref:glycosyltransferase family 2 protein n=1 Tax=Microbacterium sp. NPDC006705 TaxID=3364181 RepID=UPI00384DCC43
MSLHDRPDPTVDIVMRTKDRPLFLARAIDDVLAQTHTGWMLVIVNDGGAPGPVDAIVADRAHALAGRVSVLHREVSGGMESAANAAIRSSGNTWIAVHDDDDTWDPRFLESTSSWLSDNNDASAVAVRTEIVWERVEGERIVETSREIFLPDLQQVTLAQLIRFNCCVPISLLYRRSALEGVGLFDESLEVVGDWECNVRLAVAGPIGFLRDEPLAQWRQRPGLAGVLGNSVITKRDEHYRADRLVRDRELRQVVERDGVGMPLYLTRFLDDRFDELHRRLDDVRDRLARQQAVEDRRPVNRLRRLARRTLRRGGRS